jgi:hypothetical protein
MNISALYDETGIIDHFYRSLYFLNAARSTQFEEDFSWNILASIYSSRAIFEIVYTKCNGSLFGGDKEKLTRDARIAVRRFKVIESVRIQDFHRGAVKFNPRMTAIIGPMSGKTSSQRGSLVSLFVDLTTGKSMEYKLRNASLKHDRTIKINALAIEDHDTGEMVPIDVAVEQYLRDMKIYLTSINQSLGKSLSIFFADDVT